MTEPPSFAVRFPCVTTVPSTDSEERKKTSQVSGQQLLSTFVEKFQSVLRPELVPGTIISPVLCIVPQYILYAFCFPQFRELFPSAATIQASQSQPGALSSLRGLLRASPFSSPSSLCHLRHLHFQSSLLLPSGSHPEARKRCASPRTL